MPAHQYVITPKLGERALQDCRLFDRIVDEHPESYLAYFRGSQRPTRYLEIGDGWRYWKVWIRGRSRAASTAARGVRATPAGRSRRGTDPARGVGREVP